MRILLHTCLYLLPQGLYRLGWCIAQLKHTVSSPTNCFGMNTSVYVEEVYSVLKISFVLPVINFTVFIIVMVLST